MASVPTTASLVSVTTQRLLLMLGVVGAMAFLYGVFLGDDIRAWQTLLVNFLFFAGLAQAGVVLSALLHTTSARWGRSLKRVAEATAAFLPVSLVLLIVLLAGVAQWAPWVHEPVALKQAWLSVPFFVIRQIVGFLLLAGLSVAYVYTSLRPDIGQLHESGAQTASGLAGRLIVGWRGLAEERGASQTRQDRLAPAVLLVYGVVFSLVGVDFVMALDPEWSSTLVGAYFFVGNLFLGVAFLALIAAWGRDRLQLEEYVGAGQLRDTGTLLFGFCIIWAYMVWSQYLVIWYADLPEETAFLIRRMEGPWAPVAWLVFAMAFLIPFVVLLSRAVKSHARGLTAIALVVIVGLWLERFILVSPSLWRGAGVPLGILEILITAGMFGLFVVCYTSFLRTFPVLVISDPRLDKVAPTS